MNGAIFISYRRDDSEGEAGRLYDDLIRVFPVDSVFMDVSGIHPGKDFRNAIDESVAKCAVLLAIIGPAWTTAKDATGARRIDQPNDFVRLEISSSLARGIDVIPVLVHGARMPTTAELPEGLQSLAYRNFVELSHARWNSDVEVLSRSLRAYVGPGYMFPTRSIHVAITGQTDPQPRAQEPTPSRPVEPVPAPKKSLGLKRIAAAFFILLVAATLGAFAYRYIHHFLKHHDDAPTEQAPENSMP